MRKMFALLSILVLASLLAACGTVIPTSTVDVNATSVAATVKALVPPTATPNVVATSVAATLQALGTPQVSLATPTLTSTSTPTILSSLRMRSAEDIRNFFANIEGWVSGGDKGQWVAGAQGTLAKDLNLKEMPEGMTFEFECIQYYNLGGKLNTKKVCENAVARYSETIPADSFGTVWLEWAVKGSAAEKWGEGFVNKPCKCPSGDCRVK